MFKLRDAYRCHVLVAKALDFESTSSYVLNITASNVSNAVFISKSYFCFIILRNCITLLSILQNMFGK